MPLSKLAPSVRRLGAHVQRAGHLRVAPAGIDRVLGRDFSSYFRGGERGLQAHLGIAPAFHSCPKVRGLCSSSGEGKDLAELREYLSLTEADVAKLLRIGMTCT